MSTTMDVALFLLVFLLISSPASQCRRLPLGAVEWFAAERRWRKRQLVDEDDADTDSA